MLESQTPFLQAALLRYSSFPFKLTLESVRFSFLAYSQIVQPSPQSTSEHVYQLTMKPSIHSHCLPFLTLISAIG